jgi:hypothetical protein
MNNTSQKVESTLFAISANSSSLTWYDLQKQFQEMPKNGYYGLVIFEPKINQYKQIIPTTNFESFLNLLEQAHVSVENREKLVFLKNLQFKPDNDHFILYNLNGSEWNFISKETNPTTSFFSQNTFSSWVGSSFVRLYLVVLILVLLFFDIVFPTKAIKI